MVLGIIASADSGSFSAIIVYNLCNKNIYFIESYLSYITKFYTYIHTYVCIIN